MGGSDCAPEFCLLVSMCATLVMTLPVELVSQTALQHLCSTSLSDAVSSGSGQMTLNQFTDFQTVEDRYKRGCSPKVSTGLF